MSCFELILTGAKYKFTIFENLNNVNKHGKKTAKNQMGRSYHIYQRKYADPIHRYDRL